MNVDFRRIQAFIAVAETGSFSRAAEKLNLTQPALSARIRELEADIGVKFFSRTTRFVRLTTDGERFLMRSQRILSELDALFLEMHDQAQLRRGRVVVACVPAVASYAMPYSIKQFVSVYPGIRVEFLELTSSEVEKSVLDGMTDFGICGRTARHSDLDIRVVVADEFVALTRPDHPFSTRRSIPLKLLRTQPLIVMRRGSNVRSALETAFGVQGWELQPAYETTHHYSVAGMVEAGLGIGTLPRMTVEALRCTNLRMKRITQPAIKREIGVITRHGFALSPAAREFMNVISRCLEHEHGPLNSESSGRVSRD